MFLTLPLGRAISSSAVGGGARALPWAQGWNSREYAVLGRGVYMTQGKEIVVGLGMLTDQARALITYLAAGASRTLLLAVAVVLVLVLEELPLQPPKSPPAAGRGTAGLTGDVLGVVFFPQNEKAAAVLPTLQRCGGG